MQAIESAALSLAKISERAHFPYVADGKRRRKRRREITDALRTIYWSFSLSAMCNNEGYKALERRFAARGIGVEDLVLTNRWKGYFFGRHLPQAAILSAVEAAHPGANACLRSPLWPALAAGFLTSRQIHHLIENLDPEIRFAARRGLQTQTVGAAAAMLERRASLDALAAAILLLRLANLEGRHGAAFDWGKSVWRLMVLLGADFVQGGIAQAMADLVEERIMPMAGLDGVRFGFPPGSYLKVIPAFVETIYHVVKKAPDPYTEHQLLAVGRAVLDGAYGYDCLWAFNPSRLVTGDACQFGLAETGMRQVRLANEHMHLHQWGLNMLQLGGHRGPPPAAASSGEDLWAVAPHDPYVLLDTARIRARES